MSALCGAIGTTSPLAVKAQFAPGFYQEWQ